MHSDVPSSVCELLQPQPRPVCARNACSCPRTVRFALSQRPKLPVEPLDVALSVNTVVLHRLAGCLAVSIVHGCWSHFSSVFRQIQVCQWSAAFLDAHIRMEFFCALLSSPGAMCSHSLSRPDHHSSLGISGSICPESTVRFCRLCFSIMNFGTDADFAPRSIRTVCHLVFRPLLLCRLVWLCWLFPGLSCRPD